MGKLDGKIAIVTGGSRGIGSGICKQLALEGATVAVNYASHAAKAESVVAEIRRHGGRAESFQADVAQKADADRMTEAVVRRYGTVDILVNNAGVCPFRDFFAIDEQTWDTTLDTNLKGMFLCSQAAAKVMRDRGSGVIVNISTITAVRGGHDQVHYAASKGGVNSLTTAMATTLGKYGIRVNGILCGGVPTDSNYAQRNNGTLQAVPKEKAPWLPAGRIGDPEDLGKAVVFLAGDDSEWIAGALLAVDGGYLAT